MGGSEKSFTSKKYENNLSGPEDRRIKEEIIDPGERVDMLCKSKGIISIIEYIYLYSR